MRMPQLPPPDGTEWPATDQNGGWHHMGGNEGCRTRRPQASSTKNCKVFRAWTIYTSADRRFLPTRGPRQGPTYNIVRLALRLGDHLSTKTQCGLTAHLQPPRWHSIKVTKHKHMKHIILRR